MHSCRTDNAQIHEKYLGELLKTGQQYHLSNKQKITHAIEINLIDDGPGGFIMNKKAVLSLLILLGITSFVLGKRPVHSSLWDFHGEIHLEMTVDPSKWFVSDSRSLNGILKGCAQDAVPGAKQVPFIESGTTGTVLNQISIPIPIYIQNIQVHQYKDGTFTFNIEHICSALNDQFDLQVRMPFIGYPLKDEVYIRCKGVKLNAYIDDCALKVRTNNAQVRAKLNQELPVSSQQGKKKSSLILAEHVSLIMEDADAVPFIASGKVSLSSGNCCIPFWNPNLGTMQIHLRNWQLTLVKNQKDQDEETIHTLPSISQHEIEIADGY